MANFKDLNVYKEAFAFAMQIFELTKSFPPEEKYGLVSQMRRSSRAVCSCIGEGYRKRKYPKHFISKLSDADMENAETQVWLDFAFACSYITKDNYEFQLSHSSKIGRMLNYMMNNAEKFLPAKKISS